MGSRSARPCSTTSRKYAVEVDMHDAAAIYHLRGPMTPEQGLKLLNVLQQVEYGLLNDYVRPKDPSAGGLFWKDFIDGRELALERALVGIRQIFKEAAERVAEQITNVPEHSPREHRSRTPPR